MKRELYIIDEEGEITILVVCVKKDLSQLLYGNCLIKVFI